MPIIRHLDSIIATLDTEFTTHQLICVLAKNNQRDYILALANESGEQPFKALHSKIGMALSARTDLQTDREIPSINIFCDKGSSPEWRNI